MLPFTLRAAAAAALLLPLAAAAQTAVAAIDDGTLSRSLGVVTVTGLQPTALPTQIPTTMESATRAEIDAAVNATDSEDALKYFPSLLVRKRYVGDYNHAVLSSRASGTGNSARSAVYADGLLLSNWLGNGVGGLSFPPRWNMVVPEEIERVDVMYGPFSAAFPGNSVGAVVAYTTRMPTRFETHLRLGYTTQAFDLYRTHGDFDAWQAGAAIGSRAGAWSWWVNVHRTESRGQPLTFASRLLSAGSTTTAAGTPVTGAVAGLNSANQPWFLLGTGTEMRSTQDQLKLKAAWDLSPSLRASATLALWRNDATSRPASYLRNAAGEAVYAGPVVIDGRSYTGSQALTGGDFPLADESLLHRMQALSIKQQTRGAFDWELLAGRYRYQRDDKRANAASNPLPAAANGGAGTLADGSGSGWTQLAARATWRPAAAPHVAEFGLQQDDFTLHYRTSTIAGDWRLDPAGALASAVQGRTRLRSLWAQDTWTIGELGKAVLGLRAEQWQAWGGSTAFSATSAITHPARSETHLSPKLAFAFEAGDDLVVKTSLGRALRMPTVAELYGATSTTNSQYVNDPRLAPERSWTGELGVERDWGAATGRVTLFAEDTRDALYGQTLFDAAANRNVTRVQNVGRIATQGVEVAFGGRDVLRRGLDLNASLTWTDSEIRDNTGFVAVPGDTIGKRQPNIPRWRATAQATWRVDPHWTTAFGVRHAGRQYRTLNNADVNGNAYQGVSRFVVADARLTWKPAGAWSLAAGVDNLGQARSWNFHPYPQRSWHLELRHDQ